MAYRKIAIEMDGRFCVLMAMMFMLLPLPWIFAFAGAVTIHEMCHGFAIWGFGGEVFAIRLGVNGIQMETESMCAFQEIMVALAGPIGSIILLLFARWMPRMAICGAVHCFYNLLPLYPLDGGRILQNLFTICFPEQVSERLFAVFQYILLIPLSAVCIIACFRGGLLLGFVALLALWKRCVQRIV